MSSMFYQAFQGELEKIGAKPGLMSRIGRGLSTAKTAVKWGVPVGLGLTLWSVLRGLTDAQQELKQEGQL